MFLETSTPENIPRWFITIPEKANKMAMKAIIIAGHLCSVLEIFSNLFLLMAYFSSALCVQN
jgi:hypothetical protein